MSNLRFEPGCVSSTTRNLTSWAKPTLSCASFLVVPRGKMSLVRALHGRHPWPELELQGQSWGSSPKRGERENGRGEGGMTWGRHGEGLLWRSSVAAPLSVLLPLMRSVCERKTGRRKEEGERRRKRKEKNGKKFKIENFQKIKDNL
jgi:hypothetical protein